MNTLSDRLVALNVRIVNLVTDSRVIQVGDTFVAYPGEHSDGRSYIADAIVLGANAVIFEAHGFTWQNEWEVPHL
ncbi:MAG: Mur ligase domain-containing protein, partial [Gallionella sp.]